MCLLLLALSLPLFLPSCSSDVYLWMWSGLTSLWYKCKHYSRFSLNQEKLWSRPKSFFSSPIKATVFISWWGHDKKEKTSKMFRKWQVIVGRGHGERMWLWSLVNPQRSWTWAIRGCSAPPLLLDVCSAHCFHSRSHVQGCRHQRAIDVKTIWPGYMTKPNEASL